MIHTPPRQSQNGKQEWISALFTLLVLTGIYGSMDNFSSFAAREGPQVQSLESGATSSVAPPYWNSHMGYGFRSIAGDTYSSSGTDILDTVTVTSGDKNPPSHSDVRVSFYKNVSIEQVDKSLDPESARAYSRLPHGIAVIQGDIDSPSAKTIFSTLHSR